MSTEHNGTRFTFNFPDFMKSSFDPYEGLDDGFWWTNGDIEFAIDAGVAAAPDAEWQTAEKIGEEVQEEELANEHGLFGGCSRISVHKHFFIS